MARRIIDLSVPLVNNIPADPLKQKPSITYVGHEEMVPDVLSFFPGLNAEDLPEGQGWAVERVTISTHNGTDLDAPHGYVTTAADIAAELDRIGHRLSPLEIIMVNTAAGSVSVRTTTSRAAAEWAIRPPCTCSTKACA